jgi:replicative DNA helicase Mcm
VSRRKVPDIQRLAEAAARAELSDTIGEQHVREAKRLIGASLRQFGMDEDREYDADIVETGQSKSQRDRRKQIEECLKEMTPEYENREVPYPDLADALDMDSGRLRDEMSHLKNKGWVIEPTTNKTVRWIGRA